MFTHRPTACARIHRAIKSPNISAAMFIMITVTEDEIRSAMRRMVLNARIISEPSEAATFAAWPFHAKDFAQSQKAVAVVSGGNVDPATAGDVLAGTDLSSFRKSIITDPEAREHGGGFLYGSSSERQEAKTPLSLFQCFFPWTLPCPPVPCGGKTNLVLGERLLEIKMEPHIPVFI